MEWNTIVPLLLLMWICLAYSHVPRVKDKALRTSLDDYVAREEDVYGWEILDEYRTDSENPDERITTYVLNVTSLTWMDETFTDHPVWYHYVIVAVPDVIRYEDAAFIQVDNGNMHDSVPTPPTDSRINTTIEYALGVQAIAADIKMVPNQPIHCYGDDPDRTRREDDLIAWTWRQYIDDPYTDEMLLQFPMTKGAVMSIDAVAELAENYLELEEIKEVFVTGGSKRGWTAFLVAAVDDRVFAITPSVLSCLNFVEVMHHQYMAYGAWSFTNKDYWNEGLMGDIDHPHVAMMMEVIDPYSYRDRLDMPKMMMLAIGDEHFMPDDPWYFWDDLIGESFVWMLEDAGHSISNSKHGDKLRPNRMAFFHLVKQEMPLPQLHWSRHEEEGFGYVRLTTDTAPLNITAVWGDTISTERRDYRMYIGIPDPSRPVPQDIEWHEEILDNIGAGNYTVQYEIPEETWRCFFIKMEFPAGEGRSLYVSTEVNIIPDVLPYPRCSGQEECQSYLL